jgi:hypothetical protein
MVCSLEQLKKESVAGIASEAARSIPAYVITLLQPVKCLVANFGGLSTLMMMLELLLTYLNVRNLNRFASLFLLPPCGTSISTLP